MNTVLEKQEGKHLKTPKCISGMIRLFGGSVDVEVQGKESNHKVWRGHLVEVVLKVSPWSQMVTGASDATYTIDVRGTCPNRQCLNLQKDTETSCWTPLRVQTTTDLVWNRCHNRQCWHSHSVSEFKTLQTIDPSCEGQQAPLEADCPNCLVIFVEVAQTLTNAHSQPKEQR